MSTKKDTLQQILGSDTTDKSVHGQALLDVLKTAADEKEAIELLTMIFTERDSTPKRPEALRNKGIPQDEWDEIARTHGRLVGEYLKTSFFKSNTVDEFAKRVLDFIGLFPSDKEKTFALASTVFSSPFVPYRQLPGTMRRMTQHQFDHIIESNTAKEGLIGYICKLPFSTTVELASMILQVIEDEKEKDVRLALLALALNIYRSRVAQAVKETLEE